MNSYILILMLYGFALTALGLWVSRRVRNADDFFVAGRKLGPGLLFSTLLAANIGAGSTVGAAGLGFKLGLSAWWWVGSAGIGSLILAFTIGPRIRDLACRHGFLTVGDFLEHRFGVSVRVLVAVLLWFGTLAILAGQLIAFAWILNVITGATKLTGCLLGGVVVIAYFAAGGLKSAAWVNLVQLSVKGVGFLVGVPVALSYVGGFSGLQERVLATPNMDASFLSITGVGWVEILPYVVLLVPSFIVSPGLLQKIYGARSASAVRSAVALNGFALLLFSFLPVLLGMVAAVEFPSLAHEEMALPAAITQLMPFWLGAILLAAVFSAEVSSADAILFMLSTSLTRDLYQRFLNPQVSGERLLKASRLVAVGSGFAGVAAASLLDSVIEALTIFYGLLSVALFAPIVVGIYRARPGARSCTLAIVISVGAAVAVQFLTSGKGLWLFSSTSLGILLSFVLLGAAMIGGRRGHGKTTESGA